MGRRRAQELKDAAQGLAPRLEGRRVAGVVLPQVAGPPRQPPRSAATAPGCVKQHDERRERALVAVHERRLWRRLEGGHGV